jgi:U3 small nucleolar ribonucleoprotein protein IMP4
MAMRRNARLRREYLYKKSLEGKAKEDYERKEKLRAALQGERGRTDGRRERETERGSARALLPSRR